jgi:hypothetical protein
MLYFLVALLIEPRASYMLGKRSITELHIQPVFTKFIERKTLSCPQIENFKTLIVNNVT